MARRRRGRTAESRLPRRGPDGWTRGLVGRGRAERWTSSRTACSRWASRKGDAFGILAQTTLEWALFDFALGLIGAVGAAIYANSSPKDCRYVLEHSDAVGVLVEDEEQRAKIADARPRPRDLVRRAGRRCARAAASFAAEHPDGARRGRGRGRRGRPLHVHLHVGHDRPAEGLHDPAPQLLRDGHGRRRDRRASRSPTT